MLNSLLYNPQCLLTYFVPFIVSDWRAAENSAFYNWHDLTTVGLTWKYYSLLLKGKTLLEVICLEMMYVGFNEWKYLRTVLISSRRPYLNLSWLLKRIENWQKFRFTIRARMCWNMFRSSQVANKKSLLRIASRWKLFSIHSYLHILIYNHI